MRVVGRKIEGGAAAGLNGAFMLELPMGIQLVFGGAPYRMAGMTHLEQVGSPLFRVKCATEIQGEFDVEVPCEDFGVPLHWDMRDAVYAAMVAAFQGRPVFAGCMGGIGRTGTFYAVLLKVFYPGQPVENLVPMVKRLYYGSAVETGEQQQLISDIDVDYLQRQVKWLWLKAVARKLLSGDFSPLHAKASA
jgi:hypothetical protein